MNPKINRDIGARTGGILSSDAHRARQYFTSRKKGAPPSEGEKFEAYRNRQKAKQYLVKGRRVSGRIVWDVYELDGFTEPKAVGIDFTWQEEAIAFARDRSLGRMAVGFSGVRGLFRAGSGGILRNDARIELPGKESVRVRPAGKGEVIVG